MTKKFDSTGALKLDPDKAQIGRLSACDALLTGLFKGNTSTCFAVSAIRVLNIQAPPWGIRLNQNHVVVRGATTFDKTLVKFVKAF